MSEFTWGDLPKSQVDNQLITEAITQAIADHESDPTAHLGDGESLEQHKTNEVLDHPAGSALSDKQTLSEIVYVSDMNPADGWDTDNFTFDFPQVHVSFSHNGLTDAFIESGNVHWLTGESLALIDNLYKIGFNYNYTENDIADIVGGLGSVDSPDTNYAIVFKIVAGQISFKATFGDSPAWSSPYSLTGGQDYLIAAVLSAVDNEVNFYVNGDKAATFEIPTLTDWSFGNFTILTERNYNPASGHGMNINFGPLTISNATY